MESTYSISNLKYSEIRLRCPYCGIRILIPTLENKSIPLGKMCCPKCLKVFAVLGKIETDSSSEESKDFNPSRRIN